jgi:hypothetical protein
MRYPAIQRRYRDAYILEMSRCRLCSAYAVNREMQLRSNTDNKAVCSCEQHECNPLTEVEHSGDKENRAIGLLSTASELCVTSSEHILKRRGEGYHGRCSSGTRFFSE